jgi:hypothetical protein
VRGNTRLRPCWIQMRATPTTHVEPRRWSGVTRPGAVRCDVSAVRAACEATLRQNWREGVRQADGVAFAYTRPSPGHYPFQWYWDSCFTSIVWRRFEAVHARAELESLLVAQREDGFIGHTIFWDTPLNERQRFTYNVTTTDAPMTASIQPPMLAWAWRIAAGDPSSVPAIGRHYDWLAANRDLDGDGLIWIVQPDESGLDASPQFDAIWALARTGSQDLCCSCTAIGICPTTCAGSSTTAGRCAVRWSRMCCIRCR